MFERGLVYKKAAWVNWDPVDQTVLANEQVVDGKGWRSGAQVERRELAQWFVKITDYAEELLNELDGLSGWPEKIKTMQRNWIGRSEGVELTFPMASFGGITVYTTRPDTLMGATYLAVAPQHPVAKAAADGNPEIAELLRLQPSQNGRSGHGQAGETRHGLWSCGRAPPDGEPIPVWIANFVLMEYGSGAVCPFPPMTRGIGNLPRNMDCPLSKSSRQLTLTKISKKAR